MLIQILGPGCAKCKEAADAVSSAVREVRFPVQMEKITDFKKIMAFGVMSTPAVLVDGRLMCSGRAPSRAEVADWIAAAFAGSSS